MSANNTSMKERNALVEKYRNQGYPLEYILIQERVAWNCINAGCGPDGDASDMACEFYCMIKVERNK